MKSAQTMPFDMSGPIYDLDDPYLPYYYSLYPSSPTSDILCRFQATHLPNAPAASMDLSQFGVITNETTERLDIRLTSEELEKLSELKQAWVSKYVERGTICYLRLGSLGPDGGRSLVFQKGFKIPQEGLQGDPQNGSQERTQEGT